MLRGRPLIYGVRFWDYVPGRLHPDNQDLWVHNCYAEGRDG